MRYRATLAAVGGLFAMGYALAAPCLAGPGRPSADAEIVWGRKDLSQAHWSGAISHFRKAVTIDHRAAEAYVGLGRAYRSLGDQQRAREAYAAALRIHAHIDEAETGLHDVMTPAEHEQMLADIEARIKNSPQDADLQTTYAEELLERDRYDEAQKAAETALRLNAKESHANGVLGLIALHRGDNALATQLLETATRADDTDDDSWAGLADIAIAGKDFARAVVCYRHAVNAAPDHAEWHEKLAAALDSAGDSAGAATVRAELKNIQLGVPADKP